MRKTAIESIKHFFLPEVISDGTSGKKWIGRLQKKNFHVSDGAQSVLRKEAFIITVGKVYKPVVIFGRELEESNGIRENIHKEAIERKYRTPPAELAPLLREALSDEEIKAMDILWLNVMHEQIKSLKGYPSVLDLSSGAYGPGLYSSCGTPGYRGRLPQYGFVFLLSQD